MRDWRPRRQLSLIAALGGGALVGLRGLPTLRWLSTHGRTLTRGFAFAVLSSVFDEEAAWRLRPIHAVLR